ncbi:MAG: GspH/FimT family pseudopilin [Pseudoxanthomonas sp.]|nr:GspH/FimT family pseudopilin [Pseudoxanthomonas sp.]
MTPTCRPRRREDQPAASPAGGRSASGFSLIELVAVLALSVIVVSAMAFSLSRGLASTKVKAASRDIASALRYTRGQAILQREERALEVDVEARTYTAPGKATVKLPDDMRLVLRTARQELTQETAGRIRFFPDGSSTGGFVRLLAGQREWLVNVTWLTGEISLEEVRQ